MTPWSLEYVTTLKEHYRPLFEVWLWVETLVLGRSPFAFHAVNIVVHILNGWLILAVLSRLGMRPFYAFLTAMLFVIQPAYVAAIAWVSAISEALSTVFGLVSLYALLRFRTTTAPRWWWMSLTAFALALVTHESSVIFLPIIVLADRVVASDPWRWRNLARVFWPFAAVAIVYVSVTLTLNARLYSHEGMGYTLGPHVIRNLFEYIASIYVGKRALGPHIVVALILLAVLVMGTPRARFGVAWMLLAILPFTPLDVGNVSRYTYLPAVGFTIVLAEGLAALERVFSRRGPATGRVIVAVLAFAIGVRFVHFARDGVKDMYLAGERYRLFLADVEHSHPQIADGTVITITPERDAIMAQRYVQSAVQWYFRNPTLRVEVR